MYIIIKSVLILFMLIALGYGIGIRKIIRPECASDLSNFLVKIALPVTVFLSMQMEYDERLAADGVKIFCAAIIFHLICLGIGFLTMRLFGIGADEKGVWLFVCMFSNNGFMGFPLALSIYGNDGMFLMSIANVVSNFLIFSLGIKLMTMGHDIKERLSIRKMLVNNINIAVVLGLICYLTRIQLPEILLETLDYVGRITAGLSMIVVGLSLSKMNARAMFQGKSVYLLSAMRLVVIPAVTLLVLKWIPGMGQSMMSGVIILMSCLPSPSSVTIISEQYHIENTLGSKIVFISTLLCMITIPIFMIFAV